MNHHPADRFDNLVADLIVDFQKSLDDQTLESAPSFPEDLPHTVKDRLERAYSTLKILRSIRDEHSKESVFSGTTRTPDAPHPSRIGRFEIRRLLGMGGFGIVYLAYDPRVECEVALKIPRLEVLPSSNLSERFIQEARAASRLDHPNIVTVLESDASGPIPYIVSKYIAGQSLTEWLKSHPGPREVRFAAELVRQLAEGIEHAHQRGVLHRDIKPSNVLIPDTDKVSPRPKLMDFGLAKILESGGDLTQSGALLGTVKYMSPEQASGRTAEIGPESDIYSLGVILYELLTGRPPFQGSTDLQTLRMIETEEPTSVRRIRRNTSIDLETICSKCLEKKPEKRYRTAQSLADDLKRYLAGEPIEARPISSVERLTKWAKRRPGLAIALTTSSLAIVSLLVVSLWYNARLSRSLSHEEAARKLADTQLQKTREISYASDMRIARQLWQRSQIKGMERILNRYLPQPNEPDLRGFEWWHLYHLPKRGANILSGHQGAVKTAAATLDSSLIATGDQGGNVRIWEADSGRILFQFQTDAKGDVDSVDFHPDGKHLACTSDRDIEIWDISERRRLHTLRGHSDWISSVCFSKDGKTLASGAADKKVIFWDAIAGQKIQEVEAHDDWVRTVLFVTFQDYFVSSSNDRKVRIWRRNEQVPGAWAPFEELGHPYDRDALCRFLAAESPGPLLVGTWTDSSIVTWDLRDNRLGKIIDRQNDPFGAGAVAVNTQSPEIVAVARSGSEIRIASDAGDLGDTINILSGHSDVIDSLSFMRDGRLLSGSVDSTARIWNTSTTPLGSTFDTGIKVQWISFSKDNRRVAVSHTDHVKVFEVASSKELMTHSDPVGIRTTAISPDGSFVLESTYDGYLRARSVEGGKILWSQYLERFPTCPPRFSEDGTMVLATDAGKPKNVILFNAANGNPLRQFTFEHTPSNAVWSKDNRTFGIIHEGELQSFDCQTGHLWRSALKRGPDRQIIGSHWV
ncbi:protein kinase [bacterium]|nr:protein kinase [bacterium]